MASSLAGFAYEWRRQIAKASAPLRAATSREDRVSSLSFKWSFNLAVEVSAPADPETHRAGHQRFGSSRRERIEFGAILAANFDQVLEAARR